MQAHLFGRIGVSVDEHLSRESALGKDRKINSLTNVSWFEGLRHWQVGFEVREHRFSIFCVPNCKERLSR